MVAGHIEAASSKRVVIEPKSLEFAGETLGSPLGIGSYFFVFRKLGSTSVFAWCLGRAIPR